MKYKTLKVFANEYIFYFETYSSTYWKAFWNNILEVVSKYKVNIKAPTNAYFRRQEEITCQTLTRGGVHTNKVNTLSTDFFDKTNTIFKRSLEKEIQELPPKEIFPLKINFSCGCTRIISEQEQLSILEKLNVKEIITNNSSIKLLFSYLLLHERCNEHNKSAINIAREIPDKSLVFPGNLEVNIFSNVLPAPGYAFQESIEHAPSNTGDSWWRKFMGKFGLDKTTINSDVNNQH